MAIPAGFQKVEDQYFILKGKLQAGRITRAEFDAALKELMVQDMQGRYWTLGADSGKWFVHDERGWVEAPLPDANIPTPPPPPSSSSLRSISPAPVYSQSFAPSQKRSFTGMLLAVGVIVMLCLLGALAGLVVVGGGLVKLGMSAPTNTPFIVFAVATPVPPFIPPAVPSVVVVAVTATTPPTAVPATAQSTRANPTALPTGANTLPPPSTPTPPPTATASLVLPTATNTPVPPTATPVVPTATSTPQYPPGLYVAEIQVDPPEPKDRQVPTFKVTFLNTFEQPVNIRWFVKIYEPEGKQSFGETAKLESSMPVGTTTIDAPANWRAVGADPCRQFIARVFTEAADKSILEFPKPGGDSFHLYFSVCPAN